MANIEISTFTRNNDGNTYIIKDANAIPRSGGAVITGDNLARAVDNDELMLAGGTDYNGGASVIVYGKGHSDRSGAVLLHPSVDTTTKVMFLYVNGTWTWNGTACQTGSDRRLKQQITQIDDDLLTAWEDVNLVQFKYNDAVEEKSDNARLHTGYVVQQIDDACKKHNVDVSKYGLYCHEEYPERTEEVTIENEDGTTSKETKVVEEASEHYSLRYTEALIVECAYLRKCIKELRNEIEELKSSK